MTGLLLFILFATTFLDWAFYHFGLKGKPPVPTRKDRLVLHRHYAKMRQRAMESTRSVIRASVMILVVTIMIAKVLIPGPQEPYGMSSLEVSWAFFVLAVIAGIKMQVSYFFGQYAFSHGDSHWHFGEEKSDESKKWYEVSDRAFDLSLVFGFTSAQLFFWGMVFLVGFGITHL